jgi:hypothetical protein
MASLCFVFLASLSLHATSDLQEHWQHLVNTSDPSALSYSTVVVEEFRSLAQEKPTASFELSQKEGQYLLNSSLSTVSQVSGEIRIQGQAAFYDGNRSMFVPDNEALAVEIFPAKEVDKVARQTSTTSYDLLMSDLGYFDSFAKATVPVEYNPEKGTLLIASKEYPSVQTVAVLETGADGTPRKKRLEVYSNGTLQKRWDFRYEDSDLAIEGGQFPSEIEISLFSEEKPDIPTQVKILKIRHVELHPHNYELERPDIAHGRTVVDNTLTPPLTYVVAKPMPIEISPADMLLENEAPAPDDPLIAQAAPSTGLDATAPSVPDNAAPYSESTAPPFLLWTACAALALLSVLGGTWFALKGKKA